MAASDFPGADQWTPDDATLETLRAAAADCRGCDLFEDATQVVVSRGGPRASIVLVGEQPGDREDREGEPFVGPAGRLLLEALEAAQIGEGEVYLTNAVKHFRHTMRGKRRIHEKPRAAHLDACHPWLEAELRLVAPRVTVCLGASAARAVFGSPVTISKQRGTVMEAPPEVAAVGVVVTTHPSAVLRMREAAQREAAFDGLVEDLVLAREAAS